MAFSSASRRMYFILVLIMSKKKLQYKYQFQTTMTTVPQPSGFVRVNSMIQINPTGSVVCAQGVQDYVPPSGSTVTAWIDSGDSGRSSPRAGEMMAIPGRSANAATGDTTRPTSFAFTIDGASTFAVANLNAHKASGPGFSVNLFICLHMVLNEHAQFDCFQA